MRKKTSSSYSVAKKHRVSKLAKVEAEELLGVKISKSLTWPKQAESLKI
jgi:hypothetical protein